MYHILIPDNLNQAGLDILDAVPELDVHTAAKMTREATKAAIPTAHALIVRSGTQVDADLLALAENLRVVVRAGVGVDNIDLDECDQRGIVVMNTPNGNTISTAEHALGLMLALARHIPQADQSMKAGRWDRKKFMGTQLHNKTLGLIGFGRVGRALAERAQCFGLTEIAYDPFVPDHVVRHLGLSLVPRLEQLLEVSDIISLHVPVTENTYEIINAENIAKMKPGVMIINTARGKLINNTDLAAALKSGKIAGAALDVYDIEPPVADNPLLGFDNVIYTPHLGASTCEAQEIVAEQAAQAVINALLKEQFDHVCNQVTLAKL